MTTTPFATRVLEAHVSFQTQPFQTPLMLSSGPITEITQAEAQVVVEVEGRQGIGRGAIYLSDLWAWPDPSLSHAVRDSRMRDLCLRLAAELPELCGDEPAHPLELGLRLHASVAALELPDGMPPLARQVCLSPFDAAIHDAAGQALQRSAFSLYVDPAPLPSADLLFPAEGASRAVQQILRPPRMAQRAWLVVGTAEPLERMQEWIRERRYHAFKLKLGGKDNATDVARTVEVFRSARAFGVATPRLCVDSNCGNPDAASVLDYLERLYVASPEAYDALEYVEQPTGRDIATHAFDWRPVNARKPVILDEGLTDFDRLQLARTQGWGGIAVKTCKGHSFALVAAAWAGKQGMQIAMQDLTNPGLAAIHSFLMAAHLHPFNGIELNSPQYTPDANHRWLPRLKSLFEPNDGYHRLPGDVPYGLGSTL
ncbi:MAG: enolase C-terminal domain-like protein [Chloroherpetonaceae bacterium]|nr:hypothetical protein [Chthonomonadaceae bacterium]MDW8207127.1 enolase C-terminal domain-like protein [Chloroherpetonaceae bacterium]